MPYYSLQYCCVANVDLQWCLLSVSTHALFVPTTFLSTVGNCACHVAAARTWNTVYHLTSCYQHRCQCSCITSVHYVTFLLHDAMHKHGLCCHAVSVCVSVTFMSCAKTNKDIFEFFSPSGSQAILVFPCQTGWQYSDRNPP